MVMGISGGRVKCFTLFQRKAPNHLQSFLFHSGGVTVVLVLSADPLSSSLSWRLPVEEIQYLPISWRGSDPRNCNKAGADREILLEISFGY